MLKPKILVAIPAYNCENQIHKVIKGFDDDLLNKIEKVIIIDNISKDNTIKIAKKAISNTKQPSKFEVWQNSKNYNLGGTHKVAFLNAEKIGMDYVAILHGDNQATTKELGQLISSAINNPDASAILGCRFMKGSRLVGYSWQRKYGNIVINCLFSIISFRKSLDLGSGLNLFKVSDLKDHRYIWFGDNITFNIDLLLDYFKKHSKIIFTPITWTEEDQVSNARNFSVGTNALKKLFYWRINKEKFNKNNKPSDYISRRV